MIVRDSVHVERKKKHFLGQKNKNRWVNKNKNSINVIPREIYNFLG